MNISTKKGRITAIAAILCLVLAMPLLMAPDTAPPDGAPPSESASVGEPPSISDNGNPEKQKDPEVTQNPEDPGETGSADEPNQGGESTNDALSFERGVILLPPKDGDTWEFICDDTSTPDYPGRVFRQVVGDDGKLRLSYRGRNNDGSDSGGERVVYLRIADPAGPDDENAIEIDVVNNNGETVQEFAKLEPDKGLKTIPVLFDGDKDGNYAVWVPREYLRTVGGGLQPPDSADTGGDAPVIPTDTPDETPETTPQSPADATLEIDLPLDELDDLGETRATLSVDIRKKDDVWSVASNGVSLLEDDGGGESGGGGAAVKIAWISLIAVSLISLFVNILLMAAKHSARGSRGGR